MATVSSPLVTRSGDLSSVGEDKCQRAGPEPAQQHIRALARKLRQATHLDDALVLESREHLALERSGRAHDVHDQRVETGAVLRREDPRDRRNVEGVRGEAVDRLGRHPDEFAAPQSVDGTPHVVGGRGQDRRHGTSL